MEGQHSCGSKDVFITDQNYEFGQYALNLIRETLKDSNRGTYFQLVSKGEK